MALSTVETMASDQTQIRALEGSEVRFVARANKPLASADLMNDDQPTGIAVALGGDGSRLGATIDFEDVRVTEGRAERLPERLRNHHIEISAERRRWLRKPSGTI